MNPLSPMFWLLHGLASLVVAGLALRFGTRLHARLRLSHASRGYWLGVWLLATLPPLAVAVAAACMPGPLAALPVALPLPLPLALDAGDAVSTPAGLAAMTAPLPSLGVVPAGLYLAGAGLVLLRRLRGSIALAAIVRRARPIAPAAWPGVASAAEARRLAHGGIRIRATTGAISPFAVCWPRPCIVVPGDALARLGDAQLRLVLRHEAAHLQARDPQRAWLMTLVACLLWFNPFVRRIAARVQLAAELDCDARALDGDGHAGRTFAGAYLQTLRAYASLRAPATAMNHRDVAGHALRIRHMLHGDAGRRPSRLLRLLLVCAGLGGAGTLSLLQIALAGEPVAHEQAAAVAVQRTNTPGTADIIVPSPPPPASTFALDAPLHAPRITGRFGDTGSIRSRAHRGTDFGARIGTPVFAPAAGVVTAATTRYPDGPDYGTVVVLDHGDGWQTLYAHLDGFDVRVGQRVLAGERIARVGRSGRVTGPHLHLEALHHGQRVDPERLLQ